MGRFLPMLSLALAAYDLYQLYLWFKSKPGLSSPGWTDMCAAGVPSLFGGTPPGVACGGMQWIADNKQTEWAGWPYPYWGWRYNQPWPFPPPYNIDGWDFMWSANPVSAATVAPMVRPSGHPLEDWAPQVNPLAALAPMFDAFSNPIQQPVPDLPPIPYSMIPVLGPDAWRSPVEQTHRGDVAPTDAFKPMPLPDWWPMPYPAPSPAPVPRPDYVPVPEPLPSPAPFPVPRPAPVPADFPLQPSVPGVAQPGVRISPNGRVTMLPPDRALPSKAQVPEKKMRMRGAGTTWRIANAVTESRDFVREVWKGLDPKWRNKQNPDLWRVKGWKPLPRGPKTSIPTMQKMMQDIYNGVREGKMDWYKAIDNVVENHYMDKFWGKVGKELGRASKKGRRPIGYGAGPIH